MSSNVEMDMKGQKALGSSPERESGSDELVHHHAQAPHVRCFQVIPLEDLRGHVHRGASPAGQAGLVPEGLAAPKVNRLQPVLLACSKLKGSQGISEALPQHEVGRLHIPMDDALGLHRM